MSLYSIICSFSQELGNKEMEYYCLRLEVLACDCKNFLIMEDISKGYLCNLLVNSLMDKIFVPDFAREKLSDVVYEHLYKFLI